VRKSAHSIMGIWILLLLAGCSGMLKKEEIDPPRTVTYEEDLNSKGENSKEGNASGGVTTELYLIDKYGYVVPRTFVLPGTESVAKQALEYLVAGGPVTEILPDDFRAVLPEGTEMTVDIQDGIATIDFSKEFAEYAPEDELKIVQAVTWTVTQFDTVNGVKFKMNGSELTEMPVNKTPIPIPLTRSSGINWDYSSVPDITNTRPVVLYYMAQTNSENYFVPVTKRISNKEENIAGAVIRELVRGPEPWTELFTLLMPDVQLVEEPELKDGIVRVNFNENILSGYGERVVDENVLKSIALSLTELDGVEGIAVEVNGKSDIFTREGADLSEPVTRPKPVNVSGY
jgi:Sporulation and spore germination.